MKKVFVCAFLIVSALFYFEPASAEKKQPKKAQEKAESEYEVNLDGVPPEKAAEIRKELEAVKKIGASLKYQQGTATVGNNLAKINLSETYRFLGPEDAQKVLVDVWGNPPRDKSLGMIVPADFKLIGDESWGVVITYDDDGYVKDDEAASINYGDLLKQMKESTTEANEERKKNGYEPVELIGWAQPPHYDKAAHKLYWAKELSFGGSLDHTLNYDIRVLGRRGVLSLNAVGSMAQLQDIETAMKSVLGFVEFNEGNRYGDYVAGMDKVATYGIATLIAGKLAAKAGLFKVLIGLLIAGKKFAVVAVVAILAFLKKLLGRKSEEPEDTISITSSDNQAS